MAEQIFLSFLQTRSLSATRSALRRQGFLNRAGAPFSLPGLREILTNPVYCRADAQAHRYFTLRGAQVHFSETESVGLLAYNKRSYARKGTPRLPISEWILAAGGHRGLLPGAQWIAVQDALEQMPRPPARPRTTPALFSGHIFCACCGSPLFAKPRTRQPGRFDYICSKKLREGVSACACPNLDGAETDRLILLHVPLPSPQNKEILRALERRKKQELAACPPAQTPEQALQKNQREVRRLVDFLASTPSSAFVAEQINQKLAELEKQAQQIQQSLSPPAPSDRALLLDGLAFLTQTGSFRDFLRRPACLPLLRRLPALRWDGQTLSVSETEDKKQEFFVENG